MDIVKEVIENQLTLVDNTRCRHIVTLMEEIRDNNIPGDLVETGVYKGGCSMIMAYYNKKFNLNRTIWCYDSFEGCPDPTKSIHGKHKDEAVKEGDFSCDLESVLHNFRKFGLVENVKFIKGWFEDTTKEFQPKSISLLRFDGDMYSSTLDVLNNLYSLVVSGGYVIIDDSCLDACRAAVFEYREKHNITAKYRTPYDQGDPASNWWRKD